MSNPNKVTELFRAELKELKIAPKSTAAKNPSKDAGKTSATSIP